MRIALLNQYFAPDVASSSQLATGLAQELAERGHSMVVVVGARSYAASSAKHVGERLHPGIEIERIDYWAPSSSRLTLRGLGMASYWGSLAVGMPRIGACDVVVAMTSPPMMPVAGAVLAATSGASLVIWCQDLYPEIAVALGALRASPIASALMAASGWAYGRASQIVAIGSSMADRLERRGVACDRLAVVSNWADGAAIRRQPEGSGELRAALGLSDRFVVMYSGNLGVAQPLAAFAEAMGQLLSERPQLALVVSGDGAQAAALRRATEGKPGRALFLPYFSEAEFSSAMALGDLHVVAQDPRLEGLLLPSKLFGILAAGRPALALAADDSELARTVRELGVGGVANPINPASIRAAVEGWVGRSREDRAVVGRAARSALEARFERRVSTARIADIVEACGA